MTKDDEFKIVIVEPGAREPTDEEKAAARAMFEEAIRAGRPPVPWVTPFPPESSDDE